MADQDSLTGLTNRTGFEHALTRHVDYAARYGNGGSVLALGIDTFKYVNETLGSAAGDELLVELVEVMRGRLRRTDVLARVGGDVFGILVHGADRTKAVAVAAELLERTRKHAFVIAGEPLRISLSAGVTSLDERPVIGAELLAEAEAAMHAAKESGRDRVLAFSTEAQGLGRASHLDRTRPPGHGEGPVRPHRPAHRRPEAGRDDPARGPAPHARRRGRPGGAASVPRDGRALRAHRRHRPLGHPAGGAPDRGAQARGPRPDPRGEPLGKDDGRRALSRRRQAPACQRRDRPGPADLRGHRDGRRRRPRPGPQLRQEPGGARLPLRSRRLRRRLRLLQVPQAPADQLPEDRRRVHPRPAREPHRSAHRQGDGRRLPGARDQDRGRVRRRRADDGHGPRPRCRLRPGLPPRQAGAGLRAAPGPTSD